MEDDDSIFNADLFDSEADHLVADRPVSDRSVTDRSLLDRSLIERSYSGYLDHSVADRSMADRSHVNSLIDHFEMSDRSSVDNQDDNISGNISCYMLEYSKHILFLIFINYYYYYYHKREIIEALELDRTNSKKDLCDFCID